ncbi:MAG: undecaprenyl/decaprenyl-phosphate alpha-N-acetylglucosaminyl 1-phosphate transferase, partial [Desulfamplus sp.]|nr:undecaprenyl/decaprenyl-phosphate alpha-N-acetylglucosaminyl 1-phosphate transferase [Desulfamplus sp.]
MYLFIVFIFSLFLTIGLIPIVKRMAFRANLVDEPDSRKVHVLPMPRSGGISMALGAIIPVLLWVPIDDRIRAVLIGCAVIVFFGVVDDIKNLKYTHKLLAQTAGALLVIFWADIRIHCLGNLVSTDFILPSFFAVGLTLFFIVGVTNAINLSDGLDGLAGGISMLSFVSIGFLAYRSDNMQLAILSSAVIGAILGFLRYNTHPATIFMGDGGSQMLGFLCAVFTLMLTQYNSPYSQVTPLFLIGFPILDTLTVMIERIINGGSPFKPDKNHFHHKLMKLGLYHSESVITIYLIQTIFIFFAFSLRFYSNWVNLIAFTVLAGTTVFLFAIAGKKRFRFRKKRGINPPSPSMLAIIGGEKFSIRFFFNAFKWGLVLLLFFQCIICQKMPLYMSAGALLLILLILVVRRIKPYLKKEVLRVALYSSIPLLIYFSTTTTHAWVTHEIQMINNAFFIILIVFVIATLNLTKRQKGFRLNPLDYLVFIVIIIFPNLPTIHMQDPVFKLVVAKILILFFSYEVLLGELRKEDTFLDISLIASFMVIVIKSFI